MLARQELDILTWDPAETAAHAISLCGHNHGTMAAIAQCPERVLYNRAAASGDGHAYIDARLMLTCMASSHQAMPVHEQWGFFQIHAPPKATRAEGCGTLMQVSSMPSSIPRLLSHRCLSPSANMWDPRQSFIPVIGMANSCATFILSNERVSKPFAVIRLRSPEQVVTLSMSSAIRVQPSGSGEAKAPTSFVRSRWMTDRILVGCRKSSMKLQDENLSSTEMKLGYFSSLLFFLKNP